MIHLQNLPHLHNDRDAIEFRRHTLLAYWFPRCEPGVILKPASLPPLACDLTLRSDHEWMVRLPTNAGRNPTRAGLLLLGEET